ncbi:MAG TPA: sugar ABC transporter ATP-binding protein, partial [Citreicella sp.]|nr:sugar ABC transporter ATP-binding protein [Citreicella sp.]
GVAGARQAAISIPNLMLDSVAGEVFPPRPTHAAGDIVFEARGLTRQGDFQDVSFAARRGEILGIF